MSDAITLSKLLLLLHGTLELLLLKLILQHLNLTLEQFIHKLGHFFRGDLTRLLLGKYVIYLGVGLFEVSVRHALNLVAAQECADELFGDTNLDHARVILVHGEEDVRVHLFELVAVDEDVCQVLDGLLIVNSE